MSAKPIKTYTVYAMGLFHGGGCTTIGIERASQFQTPSGLAAASFSSYFPVGSVVN
jgi:hypothetical protein